MKWVSIAANNTSKFNALELAGSLNIPFDKHLIIQQLIIGFSSLTDYDIKWDRDRLDDLDDTSGVFETNSIRFSNVVASSEGVHYKDLDIHVYSELDLRDLTGGDVSIAIGYEFGKGPMQFDLSFRDLVSEYRIIGVILPTAGGVFHKTGDYKRLGVEN